MKIMLHIAALALAFSAKAQGNSEAVLNFTNSATSGILSGTLGWTFTPLSPLLVSDLGVLSSVVGSQGPIEVGIWAPNGTLLASNTITSSSSLTNFTRYESITPVLLNQGSIYHIGAFSPTSGNLFVNVISTNVGGSVAVSPDLQLRATAQSSSSTFSFPVESSPLDSGMYLAANFRYSKTTPEPSSVVLLAFGVVALAVFRRKN